MSFGQNLQFLRKLQENMTQEQLAEKLDVSRQTISKWEMDAAFPEMDKAIGLSRLFACSLDELLVQDMCSYHEAYSNMRFEIVPAFEYVRYAVISGEPEEDAANHVNQWAVRMGIENPEIIGWDFPFVSLEQTNVYHMHGYTSACILPPGFASSCPESISQPEQSYAAITISDPFSAAFSLIPNAYKTLLRYMGANGTEYKESANVIACFEKLYKQDGVTCMDVYIAADR